MFMTHYYYNILSHCYLAVEILFLYKIISIFDVMPSVEHVHLQFGSAVVVVVVVVIVEVALD